MKNTRYYPFERNRYFYGKLLTVRDFESEQKYFNDKRRLINRLLFGSGVVCGLQVIAVDDKTISMEAGVAIDSLGREIVVASPVTQKLSMIEGFINNEYSKNIYLCIAYDEKGKEPVHSVATSSVQSDEISEYNRVHEGYRLIVKEEAPDPSDFGFSKLVEDTMMIYNDKEIRIWQKTPRYVNPDEVFEINIRVEKAVQAPWTEFEYEVVAEHIYPVDEKELLKVSFSEPEYAQKTEYEFSYLMKAGSDFGKIGKISVKSGMVRLKIGDRQIDAKVDCENTVQIIKGSIRETVLKSYFDLSLDQCIKSSTEQYIYLAKINLLHMGPTFIIENVEKVPFGEYIYNTSALYKLGIIQPEISPSITPGRDVNESVNFVSELKDNSLTHWNRISTGVVDIDLGPEQKAGDSIISNEVDHGLGLGPVFMSVGLEEAGGIMQAVEEEEEENEQIFYGAQEVFRQSRYQSSTPPVSFGTVVYPKKGTFIIGIRLQSAASLSQIRVRWWAFRNG